MKEIQGLLKQNEELLQKMKIALKAENGHFVEDGLLYRGNIHYEDGCWKRKPSGQEDTFWKGAPLRVMFLMKDYTNESMDDIRCETGRRNNVTKGQDYIKRDSFTMNIVYWLYGLTHLTTNPSELFSEIEEGSDCFRFYERYPLLRLNCKKLSGGSTCSNKVLQKYLDYPVYSNILSDQIRLFNANVIVCCGGGSCMTRFVMDRCYNTDNWQQFEGESLWYDEKNERLIINPYHPSSRASRRKLFEGLTTPFLRFVNANPVFKTKMKDMKVFEENMMQKMSFAVIED
jgi:hypothetical protein